LIVDLTIHTKEEITPVKQPIEHEEIYARAVKLLDLL
jgi:hypothetical protein